MARTPRRQTMFVVTSAAPENHSTYPRSSNRLRTSASSSSLYPASSSDGGGGGDDGASSRRRSTMMPLPFLVDLAGGELCLDPRAMPGEGPPDEDRLRLGVRG